MQKNVLKGKTAVITDVIEVLENQLTKFSEKTALHMPRERIENFGL